MNTSRLTALTFAFICICAVFKFSYAASFTPLGALPSDYEFHSTATAVSADGSVVTGQTYDGNRYAAFRWTSEEGMTALGNLRNLSSDISENGSVIVGKDDDIAYRWTESMGMDNLGVLEGQSTSRSQCVSADGVIVYGISGMAFKWTLQEGMIGVSSIPTNYRFCSDDVTIFTGTGYSPSAPENQQAYIWSESEGLLYLGFLHSTYTSQRFSRTNGISANGKVVVGYSASSLGWEAFRWTKETGMIGLGEIPGSSSPQPRSTAYASSATGSVIVGAGGGGAAVVWTAANGLQNIQELLESDGIDLSRWHLSSGTGVSADGGIIVGSGTNPDGHTEAWIADLSDLLTIADGDINIDGEVNVADIMLGLQALSDVASLTPQQFSHGDVAPLVNGLPDPDGLFTLGDLLAITRKALGLISI